MKKQYRIVWEDEPKSREIELFVDYLLVDGQVQVETIRPTRVTFYDAETKQAERVAAVYSVNGREMLVRQYLACRSGQPSLEEEILAQHQSRHESLTAGSAR